jgi:hypothetical protein
MSSAFRDGSSTTQQQQTTTTVMSPTTLSVVVKHSFVSPKPRPDW